MKFLENNPCVRGKQIGKEEKHICYVCGRPIPMTADRCEKCSLLICPHCLGCYCTLSEDDKATFIAIYNKYCRDYVNLEMFDKIEDIKGSPKLIKNYEKCLKYCSKRLKLDDIIR